MDTEEQELAMMKRAVGGDTVALKLLLTDSHPRLCRHLSRMIPPDLGRVLDLEDVLQEVYTEVFQQVAAFEPRGRGSFHSWVAAIAHNRLRNQIKRYRAVKRGGGLRAVGPVARNVDDSTVALFDILMGSGQTPSRSVARGEAIQAVKIALGVLPEHYQQAVWLVHIEGRAVKEVAARMGRTERAVHGLCRRGLKLLQDELGNASRYLSFGG